MHTWGSQIQEKKKKTLYNQENNTFKYRLNKENILKSYSQQYLESINTFCRKKWLLLTMSHIIQNAHHSELSTTQLCELWHCYTYLYLNTQSRIHTWRYLWLPRVTSLHVSSQVRGATISVKVLLTKVSRSATLTLEITERPPWLRDED